MSEQLALGSGRRSARFATQHPRRARCRSSCCSRSCSSAAVVVAAILQTHLGVQSPGSIDPLSVATTPSGAHRFGTDELGRDVLSRTVVGARSALVGPLVIAISGFIVSALIGIGAGYVGGLLDSITMRIVDFMFALPGLLIAIVIVTIVQGGYWVAVLVLAVLNVQGDIRLVRGATLAQRSLAYVEAERVVGLPAWSIMYRHIARNILPILLADLAVDFGGALVALAGLAFLGLGAQPGTRRLGADADRRGRPCCSRTRTPRSPPASRSCCSRCRVNLIGDWLYDRRAVSVGSPLMAAAEPARRARRASASTTGRASGGEPYDPLGRRPHARPGRDVGIVGESGSGKSMLAKSLIRLLPRGRRLERADRLPRHRHGRPRASARSRRSAARASRCSTRTRSRC